VGPRLGIDALWLLVVRWRCVVWVAGLCALLAAVLRARLAALLGVLQKPGSSLDLIDVRVVRARSA